MPEDLTRKEMQMFWTFSRMNEELEELLSKYTVRNLLCLYQE